MNEKKIKNLSITAWIGYILLVLLVLFSMYTVAKYVLEQKSEPLYIAKNFYLESDMLADNTSSVPQYNLKSGVDDILFLLMNYPDELRTSEVDITGKVILTGDSGFKYREQAFFLEKSKMDTQTILFENLEPGTYMVTVTDVLPYMKTLQAEFTIMGLNTDITYSVSDTSGSPNLKVTVTSADYFGYIVISWPDGVLPDNTDPLLSDAAGHNHIIEVEKNSEYTFQFFKSNPNENYSKHITVSTNNS